MSMTVASTLATQTADSRALTDLQQVFDRHFQQYLASDLLAALLNAPAELADITQQAGNSYVIYPHELHKINQSGNQLVATMLCTASTA